MKTCTYYKVESKQVRFYGDALEVHKHCSFAARIKETNEYLLPLPDETFEEIHRVPVHRIVFNGETNLIAIDPELKGLIEKPLLEELEFEKRFSQRVRNNSDILSKRIEQFNLMTKWQKIKFILKGNWL